MIFDFRPSISIDPEEAQLSEGGANAWDNCGAANYAWILKQLGFGDPFEPQQVMDLIEGKNYHGGEVSWKLINFFKARIPSCPDITVEQGGDIVVRARLAAAQDFLTCNWWWSNSNGDIQAWNTGILHWSSIIYDTGAALGVRNTMRAQVVELPYASARAAYAGEFTTFHQAIGGQAVFDANDIQILQRYALAGAAGAMGVSLTEDELNVLCNQITPKGDNVMTIIGQIAKKRGPLTSPLVAPPIDLKPLQDGIAALTAVAARIETRVNQKVKLEETA